MKRQRGLGHAKLLLFGEHAAVYGHPALGISLAETTTAELALEDRPGWRFPGLDAGSRSERSAQEALLSRMLCRLHELSHGSGPGGGKACFRSRIPPGLGFGSSAALCAAAASALAAGSVGIPELWAWAHEAERLFHGTPSGIDTGLALLDGMYLFQPAPPGLPAARRLSAPPLDLVIGAVPRHGDTSTLVRGLGQRVAGGDRAASEALHGLGRIARRAADLLEESAARGQRHAELGELANLAQLLLSSQGLSTPELDALLREGLSGGALGGKLSGAGGGGAFFLVCPEADSAARIAARLRGAARRAGLPTAGAIRALHWES